MLKFFFNGSPNPSKVALFLEESGIPYEPVPIDIRKGEQFSPALLAINPNGKVPAIVDTDGAAVFDSNAILLYLADKTGKFLPAAAERGQMLSWLMFVATGIGPYSGQAVHFKHYAPEKDSYARTRYQFEAERHYAVADQHMVDRRYMIGDTYTIIDMAMWGWARHIPFVLAGENVAAKFPNLQRLVTEISERPAAKRALALKDKFTFQSENDDKALNYMFRHRA